MHGNHVTTNVAIFWAAGTKPGDTASKEASDAASVEGQREAHDRKAHWDHIYQSKTPTQVSWFQEHAAQSLNYIARTGVGINGRIIDVGGGTATLVDDLLELGYSHLSVLDISEAAISRAKMRLGERAGRVEWIAADITSVELPSHHYDVWHDRAVFHFLTVPHDRELYMQTASAALKPDGHLIIATFATDGPAQCSGLDVIRYSPEALATEVGRDYRLIETTEENHPTPFGTQQEFVYCRFLYAPASRTASS